MICENPKCHCQGELGVVPGAEDVCSELCLPFSANLTDACYCGHPGCLPVNDAEMVPRDPPSSRGQFEA